MNENNKKDEVNIGEVNNKEKKLNLKVKWDYFYYIIYIIIGIYLKNIELNLTIEVGDFGKLVPAMFFTIAAVSIKWIPYLGGVGFILTIQKERLNDIIGLYFIFTLIVISTVLITIYLL